MYVPLILKRDTVWLASSYMSTSPWESTHAPRGFCMNSVGNSCSWCPKASITVTLCVFGLHSTIKPDGVVLSLTAYDVDPDVKCGRSLVQTFLPSVLYIITLRELAVILVVVQTHSPVGNKATLSTNFVVVIFLLLQPMLVLLYTMMWRFPPDTSIIASRVPSGLPYTALGWVRNVGNGKSATLPFISLTWSSKVSHCTTPSFFSHVI